MNVRIHIERVRGTGVDERKLRAVLRQLPEILESKMQDRGFTGVHIGSLRAHASSDGTGEIALALAEALLRGLP